MVVDEGNIASLTYSVNGTRIELLFWKNEEAGYSNMNPPTVSRMVAVCEVIQTCLLSAKESSWSALPDTLEGASGSGIEVSSESRRMSDAPR